MFSEVNINKAYPCPHWLYIHVPLLQAHDNDSVLFNVDEYRLLGSYAL